MNKKLLKKALGNTSGAALYIFLVSQLMQNGSKLFGEKDNAFTPFFVLMLFSLSAAVVGGLVFGLSVKLFMDGKKQESITAAFYSVGWLSVFAVFSMILLILVK